MDNIDKIIYINLDRRKDRRRKIEQEFIKMDIPQEKIICFTAINNIDHPCIGCTESHLEVLKLAKQSNYKNILMLEDDFTFLISKEKFNDLLGHFFTTNIPYDVVMLSYRLIGEQLPYNNFLGKCINVQTTSGYLIHNKFYNILIDNLQEGLQKLKETHQHWIYATDQYWKKLQPISNWFYFLERIGKQRVSYSDVAGSIVNYNV